MGIYAAIILSILFSLLMIYIATIHFRKGNLSPGVFILWLSLFGIFIVFACTAPLWPSLLERFPVAARLFDIVIAVLIISLILNSFRNAVLISKLDRRLVSLTRDIALRDAEKEGKIPPAEE